MALPKWVVPVAGGIGTIVLSRFAIAKYLVPLTVAIKVWNDPKVQRVRRRVFKDVQKARERRTKKRR